MFLDEMVILKTFTGPNFDKIVDVFQDTKNYFVVSDHTIGLNLYCKIAKLNNYTEFDVANIIGQILQIISI